MLASRQLIGSGPLRSVGNDNGPGGGGRIGHHIKGLLDMKKLIGGLVAGAVLAFTAVTAQAQDVVKFGVAAEPHPPFSEKDPSGKWIGFEMDLYKAVCEATKMNCELVEVAWDGIIPALTEKKIDV